MSLDPSGSNIVFQFTTNGLENTYDLYITDTSGSMTYTQIAPSVFYEGEASWSPLNNEIAFVSARDGSKDIYKVNYGVDAVFGTGDDVITQLTFDNAAVMNRLPVFSSDGSKIAFCSNSGGSNQIWIMNSDGTGLNQLTNTAPNIYMGSPISWSPDGNKIAYSAGVGGGDYEIFYSNADNSGTAKQVSHHNASSYGQSWDSNSRGFYYISNRDTNLLDIFYADIQTSGTPTSLTTSNPIIIHAGANANQTIDIERKETTLATLNISNLNITTRTNAEESISKIKSAINQINDYSSYFGSMQNRLEQTYNYTGISKENQTSSESQIRDLDFGEQFHITRSQIS